METSYLRMVDGTRLSNYLGLKMQEGYEVGRPTQAARSYAYIEIPVMTLRGNGEDSSEAKRNAYVEVVPACTVNVKGRCRFEVHPNPKLYEYGMAQGMYYLEPEDGELIPSIRIWLRRDLSLSDLDYAIRIYMRA